MYIAALEALLVNGPMNETRMTLKVNISSSPLKKILTDLAEKNFVEKRTLRKKQVCAATPKTRTILSHLEEFNQILPIIEMHGCCAIDQHESLRV